MNYGADSKHNKKIKNVGTDYITQGNFICSLQSGSCTYRKLRKGCSKCNNSETNNNARHLEYFCKSRTSVHKNICAFYKGNKTCNQN